MQSGKVRYIGASNYAAWQLMKALGVAERTGLPRFVSQQIYYSLQARDAEYELVPAALDQGLGILVWSPLAGGLLSGKYRRDADAPEGTRRFAGWDEPPVHDEAKLYDTIDVAGRDRLGARCVGGADRAGVHDRQARRDVGDRRRAYRGATAPTTSRPLTSR